MIKPCVKVDFEPGDEVKFEVSMTKRTMAEIKNWLNLYSFSAGEPLTDVEAIRELFIAGDASSETLDVRDDVTITKTSKGYEVCIDSEG